MPDSSAFSFRLLLLLGLMLLVASIDLFRNKRQATKFQEYGFVTFAGLIAAAVGALNDLVTSSISPEYFILGKDLPADNLPINAALYGMQVGFSAGAIAGGICLYLGRRKSNFPPLEYRWLYRRIWILVPAALAMGIILPLLASTFDPFHFSAQLQGVIETDKIAKFRVVWWIHTGLYLGLLIGLVVLLIAIRKRASLRSGVS